MCIYVCVCVCVCVYIYIYIYIYGFTENDTWQKNIHLLNSVRGNYQRYRNIWQNIFEVMYMPDI
jgi:hypothetical protein